MSMDLLKGLRKVGEAQSAAISHQVTADAQAAKAKAEAEQNRGETI